MNRKRFTFLFVLLVLLALTATACLGSKGVASTGLRQAREHFTATVRMENQMEAQYRQIQTEVSTGYSTLRLNNQLAEDCFTNTQEVVEAAMAGRYGEGVDQGPSDGTVDEQAFINAFVVNEAYPGDVALCQIGLNDLADDVRIWNADRADNFGVFWDLVRQYDDQINDDIIIYLVVEFAQVLEEKADEAGVAVPDYVYPTFNLSVNTADRAICDYYAESGDCDWNPALNNGVLTGQAAYEYMTRPILAAAVQDSFDSGVDDLDPFGGE